MKIKTETYHLSYDATLTTILCKGELRLNGIQGYQPIVEFLEHVLAQTPSSITFDLSQLRSLNSAGIAVLAEFIIKVRNKKTIQLRVQGSQNIAWQRRALKNFRRLMPHLQVDWKENNLSKEL